MPSKIEWTNETWNPVTGCDKVSQGCKNCYAEVMHKRLRGMFPDKYSHPFLGHVQTHRDELIKPLTWKKPRMIFVNSMSDLFHKDVPFEFIRTVLGVVSVCKQHTFQVLTKRADRMLEFFQWLELCDPDYQDDPANYAYDLCIEYGIETGCGSAFETDSWPLKNLWLGVSVEDQAAADQRIPLLLQVPAAVRFLSCEPLLGPINLRHMDVDAAGHKEYCQIDALTGEHTDMGRPCADVNKLSWVIAGGESGHHARPMHPDWVRSIRDQCAAAGVPFFFKQWGEWAPDSHVSYNGPFWIHSRKHYVINIDGRGEFYHSFDSPGEARKAAYPPITKDDNAWWMANTGKSQSGNILDGKQHLEFPTLNQPISC